MGPKKIEKQFALLRVALAILVSLGLAVIIILLVSDTPLASLRYLLIGPFTTARRMGNVIEAVIPLLFTGVGVSIMYAAGQTNMAAEGAFFLGAAGAAGAALLPLPPGLHPLVCIAVGGAAGALITAVPALLYLKCGAKPVVSSLMMNYVALYLGLYLINYHFYDPEAGYLCSLPFAETAKLPVLLRGTSIHLGLLLGVLTVLLGHLYLRRSRGGYAIRAVGMNMNFARYAGIPVASVILSCQLLGGLIAGAGGAVEVLGMYERFQYQALTNHGFDGILVAIMAKYHPKLVPVSALFLAYVRVGADIMARMTDVTVEIVYLIQAVIILFVASERFLAGWEHRRIVAAMEAPQNGEVG